MSCEKETNTGIIVYKGYTLIEAILTIGLSAIVLLAITGLVGSLFNSYRATRQLQIDLENSRVALSVFSKSIRSTSLLDVSAQYLAKNSSNNGFYVGQTSLYAYDKTERKCVAFRFAGERLQYQFQAPINKPQECIFTGTFHNLIDSTISNGSFVFIPSTPIDKNPPLGNGNAGRVTIAFTVQSDATHSAVMQTTVSLRDYEYIGFKN